MGMQRLPQILLNVDLGQSLPDSIMENERVISAVKAAEGTLGDDGRV